MREESVGRFLFLGMAYVMAACSGDEDLGAGAVDLAAHRLGDTVQLSRSPNAIVDAAVLEPDLSIGSLPMPTDVEATADGRIAVLDRLDRSVVMFDETGAEVGRIGRPGEGPGEFEEPYAIARSGDYLGVWDKNGRVTILRPDGSIAGSAVAVPGDVRAIWQRVPTTNWDEPLQLSREDASRRLWGLGDGSFGLLVQDRDERNDRDFLEAGVPARFSSIVHRIDSTSSAVDTLAILPGAELRPAQALGGRFSLAWERPFALRPMWAAGEGWQAFAHGADPNVLVAFDSGDSLHVRWPRDDRPLGDADYHSYIDWEIESYRRTRGESFARDAADIPRDVWIEDELSVSNERPQVMGLLASGRCLAISGFLAEDGPHGEGGTWLVVPLDEPEASVAFDLRGDASFVRALLGEAFYRIEVLEDGQRRVDRLPFSRPDC